MTNIYRTDAYGRELELGDIVSGNWGHQMHPILMEVLGFTQKLVKVQRIDGGTSSASRNGWQNKPNRVFQPGDVINQQCESMVLLYRANGEVSLPDPIGNGFNDLLETAHRFNRPEGI